MSSEVAAAASTLKAVKVTSCGQRVTDVVDLMKERGVLGAHRLEAYCPAGFELTRDRTFHGVHMFASAVSRGPQKIQMSAVYDGIRKKRLDFLPMEAVVLHVEKIVLGTPEGYLQSLKGSNIRIMHKALEEGEETQLGIRMVRGKVEIIYLPASLTSTISRKEVLVLGK